MRTADGAHRRRGAGWWARQAAAVAPYALAGAAIGYVGYHLVG